MRAYSLFDENGLTETTHVNRIFISWDAVEKVSETANYLTIHIRLGSGYFIPKRAFSSPDDIGVFVDAVETHILTANIPPPPELS